ncbi:hypothetical protein [Streptomyces fragilis]|uniref:hypothetical protein n=1 Tax=Streptomyces fragilis TaxID=67301 RepID=UPI0024DE48CA|nr:hypothetical protein [Streptomyces fragilis]
MDRTRVRYRELLAECGLDTETHIPGLVTNTGVSEPDVRALLNGEHVPLDDPDDRVRRRVCHLYESRTDLDGRPADIRDIAAALNATPTWTKKIVAGQANPSLTAGHVLCQYYGVPSDFLTATPADALNRELGKIVFDLEVKADPERILAALGVRHVAGRGPNWGGDHLGAVAHMVAGIRESLATVEEPLARLEGGEGG